MVNPFAISWLWRGFKGKSVTFALLFASFMLGMSLLHWVNVDLTQLGVHWLHAMIIPAGFFMWLAMGEDRFIPDEAERKLYARSLIAGSIVVAILIGWLRNLAPGSLSRQMHQHDHGQAADVENGPAA